MRGSRREDGGGGNKGIIEEGRRGRRRERSGWWQGRVGDRGSKNLSGVDGGAQRPRGGPAGLHGGTNNLLRAAPDVRGGTRRLPEISGCPWTSLEAIGNSRKRPGAPGRIPGGTRKLPEAPGCHRTHLETPGGARRPPDRCPRKSLETPQRFPEAPGCPGRPWRPPEAPRGPGPCRRFRGFPRLPLARGLRGCRRGPSAFRAGCLVASVSHARHICLKGFCDVGDGRRCQGSFFKLVVLDFSIGLGGALRPLFWLRPRCQHRLFLSILAEPAGVSFK